LRLLRLLLGNYVLILHSTKPAQLHHQHWLRQFIFNKYNYNYPNDAGCPPGFKNRRYTTPYIKNNNLSIPWVTKMATEAEVSPGSPQWQHTMPKLDATHPPARPIIFPLTNLL
jgi:hypothetical protein